MQSNYVNKPGDFLKSSFDDMGWAYTPHGCEMPGSCRVHVALHGCNQGYFKLGKTYMENTGYTQWAGPNKIVVIFPQIKATSFNDSACWDFWGYTGDNYATKDSI